MRRTTPLLGTAVLAGALLLSGCGSQVAGTVSRDLAPAAVVRAAVYATSTADTARVSLTAATRTGSTDVTIAATGLMAMDGSEADITVTLPGSMLGGTSGEVSVRELIVDRKVYLKLTGTSLLPESWVTLGADSELSKAGLGNLATGTSVTSLLESLRDLGEVTEVGSESVNGGEATHYRASIDPTRIAAAVAGLPKGIGAGPSLGTTPIPVDVWVDGEGRLVRAIVSFSLSAGGTTVTEKVRTDITDFGAPLDVTAPAGALDLGSLFGG